MEEEKKNSVTDALRNWGIDVERFEERAKESLETARGDLSEITGTLRQTLVKAKDVVVGMQTAGSPAAAELKAGFERAWHEIESAFKAAREKAKAEPVQEAATEEDPPDSQA